MGYINKIKVVNNNGESTSLIEPTLFAANGNSNDGTAYTATIDNFELITGVSIYLKVNIDNKKNATLKINNGGVKQIYNKEAQIQENQLKKGCIYNLIYDGTQWQLVGYAPLTLWGNYFYGNENIDGAITINPANYAGTGLAVAIKGTPWTSIRFGSHSGGTQYVTAEQTNWGQIYFQVPAQYTSNNEAKYYSTRFFFRQYSKNKNSTTRGAYREDYYLPETNDDLSDNAQYNIRTSKDNSYIDSYLGIKKNNTGDAGLFLNQQGNWTAVSNNAGTVTSVTIKAGAGISVSSEAAITDSGVRTISIDGMTSSGDPAKCLTQTGDWASFTNNIGTVTKIKINSTEKSPSSNGVVDLGTVITQHQDISGKANLNGATFTGDVYFKNFAGTPRIIFTSSGTGEQNGGYLLVSMTKTNGIYRPDKYSFRILSYDSGTGEIKKLQNNTSVYEQYSLPAVTPDMDANVSYDILTTKNTVSIGQGGTGNASFTANRLVYCNSNSNSTQLTSTTITSDGTYLANVSYLSVNASYDNSYNLYVNGTSYFTDNIVINNSSGGSSYLELKRGSNADWKIINERAILKLQSDWADAKGEYFDVMTLANTGNVTISEGNLKVGNLTIGGTKNTDIGKTISSSSDLYLDRVTNTSITFKMNNDPKMHIDSSNSFRPEKNDTLSIGTSSCKWADMYATTFHGDLDGNATTANTATKWATAQTVYVALGSPSISTSIQGGSNAVALGVNGTLGIANGGTGKTNALEAITNLGGPYLKSGGTEITEASNLDSGYTAMGTYYSISRSRTESLVGAVPTSSSGFKMITAIGYNTNNLMQFLKSYNNPLMYRSSTDAGTNWTKWYQFVLLPSGSNNTFAAIGDAETPVYVDSSGVITAGTKLGSTYLKLDGSNTMTGTINSTANIVMIAKPVNTRVYLQLIPQGDYEADLTFGRSGEKTWAFSSRKSGEAFFGLYNYTKSNWSIKVAESNNAITLATALPIASGGTGATTAAAAWTALGGKASGKHDDSYFALASHGNHVPTTATADNLTFLRCDNSWYKIAKADVSTMINLLGAADGELTKNDYIITQYANGGTEHTTYYRRPAYRVVNATLVKTALGYDNSTTNQWLNKKGTWTTPTAADVGAAPSSHNHATLINRTSLTKGTNPTSATQYYTSTYVYEAGTSTAISNRLAWLGGGVTKDGLHYYGITAYKFEAGSEVANYFRVGVNSNGSAYYAVEDPGAFRTAIGAGTSSLEIGSGASNAMAGNTVVTNVYQSRSNTDQWRKILLGDDMYSNSTAQSTATTGQAFIADKIAVQPYTGTIKATTFDGSLTGNCTGSSSSCTGNAVTATTLQTSRSLWGNTFNGSGDINGTIDLGDEKSINAYITRKEENGNGWAFTPLVIRDNANSDFAHIGVFGSANTLSYIYIGSNGYNGNNLQITSSGAVKIPVTTAASSKTTGALIVGGGAGFGGTVYANSFNGPLTGNAATASKLSNITSGDAASSTATWRRIWFSYSDNTTGRPAYDNDFAYQTSTHTMKVGGISTSGLSNMNRTTTGKFIEFLQNTVSCGYLRLNTLGTTSVEGWADLVLGNSSKSTAANNASGRIYLSNSNGTWITIKAMNDDLAGATRDYIDINKWLKATGVTGAVWNDYAEFRKTNKEAKAGQAVIDNDDGSLSITDKRLMPGAQIVSDTFGFSIGETEEAKTPLAVSGRVLAYTYRPREEYHAGMAVCSAPNGTIDIMTREEIQQYPDAIIGIVSEIPDYEEWGTGNVKVNKRIWIKIK